MIHEPVHRAPQALVEGYLCPPAERARGFGSIRVVAPDIPEARGCVAVGLEELIRLGKYRQDAARTALHDFPGISRLITAKSKDSVVVMLSWHDEFLHSRMRREPS